MKKMVTCYKTPIKETQDILLASVNYAEVIDGMNGYFTSDPRNDYITIHRQIDSSTFFLYDPEKWVDIIISWLRTKHEIFYYPGMEAKYAKAEKRIPPFTERMKNDGALRTLKKLHKIVTGVEVSDTPDSPTLIASAIETDFVVLKQDLKNALEAKESFFETKGKLAYRKELMEYITKTEKKYGICFSDLHDDEEFRPECIFNDLLDRLTFFELKERLDHKEAEVVGDKRIKQYEADIMDHIRQEASLNGFNLPEKADGEPLTIKRVFHDLLELMRIRGEELRILKSKCNRLNEIVGELSALNDEIKE